MSEKQTSANNPFFDAWWAGSEQVLRVQSQWVDAMTKMNNPYEANDYVDNAHKNWQQCEDQFQAWLSASSHWFDGGAEDNNHDSESVDALKSMLNPATFFSSGVSGLGHVFQRLAEGPDFADIGVFEKKLMRINQDWNAMHEANLDYQAVISNAWMEAFRLFSDEVPYDGENQPLSAKEMLQRWLEITNDLLVKTQRSDEFLQAQRKLLSASTQFKLQQKEVVELWCENMTIPTRSEVDDLHQIVYQLRREVRELNRQLNEVNNAHLIETTQKSVNSLKHFPIVRSAIENQGRVDVITSHIERNSGKIVKKRINIKLTKSKNDATKATTLVSAKEAHNGELTSVQAIGKEES